MKLDSPELIPTRQAWAETNLKGFSANSQGPWASACCVHPGHGGEDSRPSLRLNLETGGVKCHGCHWQGTITRYAEECSLPTEGLPTPASIDRGTDKVEYCYPRADGTPYLRVTRTVKPDGKKTFWQHRWEAGGWVKGKASPAPLFNAPALAKAPAGSTVFFCEGEKCAQHLIDRGLLATTAPEGAGKFGQVGREWLDLLLPLGVVILPDQDHKRNRGGSSTTCASPVPVAPVPLCSGPRGRVP